MKDGPYVINLDEYADFGTHWIALFCRNTEIAYFNSFGVEHVPGEIKEFIGKKIQTSKQIFLEYKQVIQKCVGTFALDSLILCLQINN